MQVAPTTVPSMIDIVPPGESGRFEVVHYTPPAWEVAKTKRDWKKYGGGLDEYTQKGGTFAVLRDHGWGEVVMSDTPMERESNSLVIAQAHGRVLIGGLGLGMIVVPLLTKKGVDKIVIVEKEADVIKLVAPHLKKLDKEKRLTIVKGDIAYYKPKGKFDVIYFDIWNTIGGSNYVQTLKLEARYKPFLSDSKMAWMGAWLKDECERLHEDEED